MQKVCKYGGLIIVNIVYNTLLLGNKTFAFHELAVVTQPGDQQAKPVCTL